MSMHVHVRLRHALAITDDGHLIEELRCKCGATWTHVHQVDGGRPER
ncbi:hypothetical protein SAMN05421505_14233 [Sinosporangium album]|uniref:HNH endonuclease n=1 Tax=Sinosporangium album TaxID=504805 RepID=A0A1G8JBL2_9ACTN|nr:hypothetical protein [Sinosporangium album]SDI28649.1 hypothetical protein SAMN05421505_14233 [Sinosporangium album]